MMTSEQTQETIPFGSTGHDGPCEVKETKSTETDGVVDNLRSRRLCLDTHSHDGPIGQLYRQIRDRDEEKNLLSFDESITMMTQWLKDCPISPAEQQHVTRAIDLMRTDRNGNNDTLNQIQVEELLPRVIKVVETFDITGRTMFLQTIGEIVTMGQCAQGRTTRLLGYYIPFKS